MTDRSYQLCLYIGTTPPSLPQTTVVNVPLNGVEIDDVVAAIRATGITPADLRARALVLIDADAIAPITVLYAVLTGFAGRRLDFAIGGEIVEVQALHDLAAALADLGKPEEPEERVAVGGVIEGIPSIITGDELGESEVTTLRYARQALLLEAPSVRDTLVQFITTSGIRVRNGGDRFPTLVSADGTEIELDACRRAGGDLRRSIRNDDRNTVVEAVALSPRQQRWVEASQVPIEAVLTRLGSRHNAETEMWQCPRPERHRNGDANPSMKVENNAVRCFRCDPESVDPLRLVVDARAMTPDEAANWLLSV